MALNENLGQINPGDQLIPELPANIAMIRDGGDAVVNVEFWDANKQVLPSIYAGPTYESVTQLTISSTAKSLAWFMKAAGRNTVALDPNIKVPGIPSRAVGGRLLVVSGTIRVNTGGESGDVPTPGIRANCAPTADSPLKIGPGDDLIFGRYRK
jgi:hypothetical protein